MAKYYYNGVLLPEIPADVLANYSYLVILQGTNKGVLWGAKEKPYYWIDGTIHKLQIPAGGKTRYNQDGDEWSFVLSDSSEAWLSPTSMPIIWTNFDVPFGGANWYASCFCGSDPVPEGTPSAGKYYYNGKLLPKIPEDILAQYPCCVLYLTYNKDIRMLAGPNLWYRYSNSLRTIESTFSLYALSKDGNSYVLSSTSTGYGGYAFDGGIVWTNHNIPDGSATATTVYRYSSLPVADSPITAPSARTQGYLIRSGSTLYTITDGTLTALAETEITASLFQTYGVDEIPDGSMLVGLTDPEVLYWQDSTDELPDLTLTVKGTPPLPQMFTSEPMDLTHESIAGISHAAVDASEDVRFAISFDGGTTWKAHDGAAWFDTSDTVPGMLPSTMNAITAEQWAEVVVLDSYMVRFWLPNVTAYVKSVVMHYINP